MSSLSAVETGQLIAEFAGRPHLAGRAATFTTTPEFIDTDRFTWMTGRTCQIECPCGASVQWPSRSGEHWQAIQYFRTEDPEHPVPQLTLLRTPLDTPPCQHWTALPAMLTRETP